MSWLFAANDTQEIKVGMLISTPTDDNELGPQFWIGKVLDVVMHENHNQITSTKVHWYNTKSKNSFTCIGNDGMPNVKRK